MNKILVILGHPKPQSLCSALAEAYVAAAKEAGAEVMLIRLGELDFDPHLRAGYSTPQVLESDLAAAQTHIIWAEHLVFVYPNWWGTMPALLKGFIDRVFLPGFAFKYRENSVFWDKLLIGRTARALVTMDSPSFYYRWVLGSPGDRQLRKSILQFCGIRPVSFQHFGPVRGSKPERRSQWIEVVRKSARKDAS
jgi:putative NADPH-quinone reductase